MKTLGKKVFVGLSGGVDSAVSAALLKEAGYDVAGVFIKVWSPDFLPCTWREERRDAMRVAAHLDIPFLFFDFEEEYKKGVADYMIREYAEGRTPNPDVMCNREVKFGALWREAKKLGADFIATGHYAQNKDGKLLESNDKEKDQSYFLWTLTQEDLEHILFPVGHLEKREVRSLAKKFDVPVAEKKDSQGVCFIGEITLEEFLSEFIQTKPGDILNTHGEKIGTHKGALFYTIGERHGFEVTKKSPEDGAFYVVSKNMHDNTITVSSDKQEILRLSPREIVVKNIHWVDLPAAECVARIRYRGEKLSVKLNKQSENVYEVVFDTPVIGLSVGQSIVFYDREMCLGGAIVESVKTDGILS